MAKKRTNRKTWLPETHCPIIPLGGTVAVILVDPRANADSPIITPEQQADLKTMAKMHAGKIVKCKIVAVAPDVLQDEEHKSCPLWKPGMLVYAHLAFEPAAETVEYMHRNERSDLEAKDVIMVAERNIVGLSRHDDQPAGWAEREEEEGPADE